MDTGMIPSAVRRASAPRRMAIVTASEVSISTVMDQLLDRAGLSKVEAAARLGVTKQLVDNVYQSPRREPRRHPSFRWFVRFVAICGGRILIEFPEEPVS